MKLRRFSDCSSKDTLHSMVVLSNKAFLPQNLDAALA